MNIRLRPWRGEDEEFLVRYANDKEIARWLRDVFPYPYTREDAKGFVAYCLAADEDWELLRVIEADGQAVGSITLNRGRDVECRSAELGYWLGRAFHGKGIMTEAVEQMCLLGFKQWDIVRIFAQSYASNQASRRVLEKAGFTLEGTLRRSVCKNGEMLDSCIYALLTEEFEG